MRAVRRARWLFCGLLLASPFGAQVAPHLFLPTPAQAAPAPLASGPVYLRLESGTWAIGGVGDLADNNRSLVLMPNVCHHQIAIVEVGVGFEVDWELTELDVAGTVKASDVIGIEILFRNPVTNKCDFARLVEGKGSSFLLQDVPVDSAIYRDSSTSVIELCLKIRRFCGPPPTDKDAVSVQDLTIGPKGGGL